jgi:hypothetical protein
MGNEEKRHYIRIKENVRVVLSRFGHEGSHREIFTEDLSEKGLQIISQDSLSQGEEVELTLEFVKDAVPIYLRARVAHVEEKDDQYWAGLEFIKGDDFPQERLELLINDLLSDAEGENH